MKQTIPLLAAIFALLIAACQQQPQLSSSDAFHALLDEHWATANTEKIFFRTDPDGWRMNGTLSEHSPAARQRRQQYNDSVLARLQTISIDDLGDQDRVSYRVFLNERETERDSYAYFDHRFPLNKMFGFHTYFAEAPANMSFLTAEDYDKYLLSLADFPRYNDEHIEAMREGIETGYTHYCVSIKKVGSSIDRHIVGSAQESELYVPFNNFPGTFSEDQKAAYSEKGSAIIESDVIPAYETLFEFFNTEYFPNCRETVGITSLPGGDEYYRYLIRYFTTVDMSPEEIHELGFSEVARIRAEMDEIIASVGFEGEFREFLEYMRNEPSFFPKTELELLSRAALISKDAEGEAPKFFSVLPRNTYKIRPNPNRGTFYMPSSGDGTTSGTYFVATESLDSQPFYTLEALSLHEGVPGHHLQSSLAQELDLPAFRRTLGHSGFGEGWGLYSERLGKEMGFYKDPYSDFGRLTYEAWRACRLVVDTGMHAFGWSRQQALDYMLANTAVSVLEANNEIDRYITWPAQALSYKIGELKIRELRAMAEAELGTAFDIRRFHDTVVGNGSVPIAVLEDLVTEWVETEKAQ